ncbi:MAG: VOC family protein [Nitrospira sp.]|nr:VOC family protein [Nitrospira sp.]
MAEAGIRGMRHLALKVTDLPRSRKFYEELFDMRTVWEPDPDNVYLSSGVDNLALHQIPAAEIAAHRAVEHHWLDHLGFIMESPASVDRLLKQAVRFGAPIVKQPQHHRDGSYSFYMTDPDGTVVQVLYEPTISKQTFKTE